MVVRTAALAGDDSGSFLFDMPGKVRVLGLHDNRFFYEQPAEFGEACA